MIVLYSRNSKQSFRRSGWRDDEKALFFAQNITSHRPAAPPLPNYYLHNKLFSELENQNRSVMVKQILCPPLLCFPLFFYCITETCKVTSSSWTTAAPNPRGTCSQGVPRVKVDHKTTFVTWDTYTSFYPQVYYACFIFPHVSDSEKLSIADLLCKKSKDFMVELEKIEWEIFLPQLRKEKIKTHVIT